MQREFKGEMKRDLKYRRSAKRINKKENEENY